MDYKFLYYKGKIKYFIIKVLGLPLGLRLTKDEAERPGYILKFTTKLANWIITL